MCNGEGRPWEYIRFLYAFVYTFWPVWHWVCVLVLCVVVSADVCGSCNGNNFCLNYLRKFRLHLAFGLEDDTIVKFVQSSSLSSSSPGDERGLSG